MDQPTVRTIAASPASIRVFGGTAMADENESEAHRMIPGGALNQQIHDEQQALREDIKYESVPPGERKQITERKGVAGVVKTIVVHDERGQIVSVTKVAPDATFGVGVKPQPGQTVKEYEAGTLAEDPFSGPKGE
jgi:hypothetical protein